MGGAELKRLKLLLQWCSLLSGTRDFPEDFPEDTDAPRQKMFMFIVHCSLLMARGSWLMVDWTRSICIHSSRVRHRVPSCMCVRIVFFIQGRHSVHSCMCVIIVLFIQGQAQRALVRICVW
jgi:hypothetical protein